jgi:hypothetical protein
MSSDHHVTVHLTEEELRRVDALLPRHSTATHEPTRADVLRALAALGMDAIERDDPPPTGSHMGGASW